MTATSFKSMQRDGVVKRADARRMRWEDLHIEPGFNPEGRHDVDDEDNQSLLAYIMDRGISMLPALEVRVREEGGAWIVDGHRRWTQIGKADKKGAKLRDKDGELWIDIVPFEGNDVDRAYRVITSNEKKDLTPLQLAEQYAKLARFNQTPSDIAENLKPKRTRQHVEQMLILASANHDVKALVKSGQVAASVAIEAVRKHGEKAGEFLAEKLKTDGKATAKTLKPWMPPTKLVQPVLETLDALDECLPTAAKTRLLELENMGQLDKGEISVPAGVIWQLLNDRALIADERSLAEEKRREKAAKASQQSIEGA